MDYKGLLTYLPRPLDPPSSPSSLTATQASPYLLQAEVEGSGDAKSVKLKRAEALGRV